MSFQTIRGTLSADVATSGTFTVAYPTGFTRGSFLGGTLNYLEIIGNHLTSPVGFTISTYGATTMTITNKGTTTWPAGSAFILQADQPGPSGLQMLGTPALVLNGVKRTLLMTTVAVFLGTPIATIDTNIRANAALATTGSFALLITQLDVPRNVIITSSGNDTGVVFTVTGKDEYGVTMSEAITGANAGIASGKKAFFTLTSISNNVAAAANVKVGVGNVLGLPIFLPNVADLLAELQDGAVLPVDAAIVRLSYMINQVDLLAPTAQDFICPVAGTITAHRTVVQAAVTTGGTLQPQINTVSITGGVATVANAATKGTRNAGTAITALNTVAVNDRISILPAAFATAGAVNGEIDITPTNANGLLVAGLDPQTPSTTTTADIRGTYVPATAPDATKAYMLIVTLSEPQYLGNPQA